MELSPAVQALEDCSAERFIWFTIIPKHTLASSSVPVVCGFYPAPSGDVETWEAIIYSVTKIRRGFPGVRLILLGDANIHLTGILNHAWACGCNMPPKAAGCAGGAYGLQVMWRGGGGGWAWLAGAWALTALATMCKEQGVTALAAAAAVDGVARVGLLRAGALARRGGGGGGAFPWRGAARWAARTAAAALATALLLVARLWAVGFTMPRFPPTENPAMARGVPRWPDRVLTRARYPAGHLSEPRRNSKVPASAAGAAAGTTAAAALYRSVATTTTHPRRPRGRRATATCHRWRFAENLLVFVGVHKQSFACVVAL